MGKRTRESHRRARPRPSLVESTSSSRPGNGPTSFAIVGIGASAGGLQALQRFLDQLSPDPGIAIVLIQHLDSRHESVLAPLLAKTTSMSVAEVSDGTPIVPNHVYTTPPGRYVAVEDGKIRLFEPDGDVPPRAPIDFFLRSLAAARRELAIGIVLSGTGSDGAIGLKEIKAAGGMTLVQDPETADFDGMPRSALAASAVDSVLPVEEMPEQLIRFVRNPLLRIPTEPLVESFSHHIDSILNLVLAHSGCDFRRYKRATVSRRIARRMGLRRLEAVSAYLDLLAREPEEVRRLCKDLLISVTCFFREKDAWRALQDEVIAKVIDEKRDGDPFRAWVPGCATGEEGYSLAIVLLESLREKERSLSIQLFGTDVDPDTLEVARDGIYPRTIATDVGPERLERFFIEVGDRYRVSRSARDSIVFATHDLLRDPPFFQLDLVSFRNLLIYLETDTQTRVLEMLHATLRDGGYLFLGKSESAGKPGEMFDPVPGPGRIFRKVGSSRKGRPFILGAPRGESFWQGARHSRIGPAGLGDEVQRRLLSRHVPPSVVVDPKFSVRYFHGAVRDFLDFPQGRPTSELIPMLPETHRSAVRRLIRKVAETDEPAETLVRTTRGPSNGRLRVLCEPLPARKHREALYLVSFVQERTESRPESAKTKGARGKARRGIGELERELEETRAELQATVEELESSNEELKVSNEEILSINEELRSSNHELESSRGELQSLNEELATINNELEDKVGELETTADDLTNFLASTEIATIFLDTNFRIRRFTPAMGSILNVIASDRGRHLADLSTRVQDQELLSDAELVLSQLVPVEKEVESDDGRWFIRRILPYRTSTGGGEGVVVTFTNVTRLKETSERLKRRERQQAVVATLGRKALAEVPVQELLDESVVRVAETLDGDLCKVLELTSDGKEFLLVSGVGWNPGLIGKATLPAATADTHAGYALQSRWPVIIDDLSREKRFRRPTLLLEHDVVSGISVVIGPQDRPWGVLAHHSRAREIYTDDDVNFLQSVAHLLWQAIEAERSRSARKEHERELALIADSAPVLIAYVDSERRYQFNNLAYERWFGVSRGELRGTSMEALLSEDAYRRVAPHVARALSGERATFELDLADAAGRMRATLANYVPRTAADGRVHGFYAVLAEVTDLKQAEERVRESEERLRLSQQAGGVGTWDWDVVEDVVICSEEFFRIYGIASQDRLSYREWTDFIHPDDRDEAMKISNGALAGKGSFENEFRILRPDGEERWLASRANVLPNDLGRPERVVGVHIDVTSRKRAEIRSEKAQAELEKASQLKDEFLAMLGHELRNPLGAISNGIQLLLDGVDGEHRQWSEQMIARQTRQLERLVDDLLDATRITRGLIEIRKEVVELSHCLAQAFESVRDLIEENERTLEVHLPEEPVFLEADPARIEQIFGNLLSNAVKYTDEGGRIELTAERTEDEVVVRVTDDGHGIPEDALDVIFEPFVRVGQSLRRAGSGLGIGLTLVKKLTDLHGGSVSARSEGLGQGTEFTVRLPLHQGAPPENDPEQEDWERPPENGLRVLVIDDNRDVGESLQKILETLGHEVALACDGPSGIELASTFRPQAALIDVGLPGMDGYEVARKLREMGRIWVGAVSGFKERGEEPLSSIVFDRYFIKPLDRGVLAEALADLALPEDVA